MARASRYGGPSHTPAELADPDLPVRIRRAEIGFVDRQEVELSAGTGSSQSSKSEQASSDKSNQRPQRPALMTESHSSQPEKETDSTADSMDGAGQKAISKPSVRKRPARVRTTDDTEDDDFFD